MRAIWQNIYRDLREDITDGTYPFQSLLPSEAVLTEHFSCSHNTLRKALATLAGEGLVQPIQGKGVRVIFRPRERALFEVGSIETFTESMARMGVEQITLVSTFEPVCADKALAQRTGFEEGTELLHVERLRTFGGEPAIRDNSYFLASAVEGLTKEVAAQSIYEYLEGTLGLGISQSMREITVEPATKRDYELLELLDGSYMAIMTNRVFTNDGIMFECTQSRHRPDFFVFHDVAHRKTPIT
ncbi:UTRA domain-containing protein [Paratractidigestivibacter sp.]|uniref:UTRA domain-containing protein n=1 Tax=Paratractidigestivibacter sp. TaxID=2847316 RepID=UPI002ABDDFBB|nr:UTRA domain-containing protein [Paratractidigestivibacter sp.]